MERFERECQFLSGVRHPHIVQYLGVSRDPESQLPVLLMEIMDSSLTRFLEQSQEPLPHHIQVDLCHDVALALIYLHANGMIHRDLSSNNVLLIGPGNRAKVTDFGMSKLANANPLMTPMTMCPGTLAYMPPEALDDPPVYTDKLDCFSFGVLDIQILTRQFPDPSHRFKTMEINDPRFPTGRVKVPVPEVERRQSHIEQVNPAHPLLPIALNCLKDMDRERPSAQEFCRRLAALKEAPQYGDSVQQAQNSTSQDKERQISELQREKAELIEQRAHQQEQHVQHISDLQQQLQTQSDRTQARESELTQQIGSLQLQLKEKGCKMERRVQELNTQIQSSELITAEFQQTLLRREETIQDLQQALAARQYQVDQTQAAAEGSGLVSGNTQQPLQPQTASQQPTALQTATPQPTEPQTATPQPTALQTATPQPTEPQTATPQPTALQTATPQPTEPQTATPQPTALQTATPQPTEPQTATPQPTAPQTATPQPTAPQTASRQLIESQASISPSKVDRVGSFQLQWREGGRAPFEGRPGSVAVDGSVAYFNPCSSGTCKFDIYSYETGTWSTLPRCGRWEFAMAVINGLLTVIGGLRSVRPLHCDSLVSLIGDGQERKWVEHFPPMPTKRAKPAVVCSGKSLVVAGGDGEGFRQLNTIDVMDTVTLQWYTASNLPSSCRLGFATLCGDQIYMRSGPSGQWTQAMLTCSLTDFLQSSQPPLHVQSRQKLGARFGILKQRKENEHPNVWREVAKLPYQYTTITSMYGQLLAVGGVDPTKEDPHARKPTDSIHRYNPTNDRWEVISHMPTARCDCLVTVLPSNELMVVGGRMHGAFGDYTNIVEIGTLV